MLESPHIGRIFAHDFLRPLLPAAQAEALTDESTLVSFTSVFETLIQHLPGDAWARTATMRERFGVVQP